RFVGIDNDKLGSIATGFLNKGPQVNIGTVDVRAPSDDVLRVAERLHVGAEFAPEDGDDGIPAGSGADRAGELRGAEPMEEAVIHGGVAQNAQCPAVGVGKNG